ncbi:FkbM family methyltransferase [Winogradskyella wandonensis]|uniref:FkbM family methyltransferase n=1 Tax=Winogradskyella wandonensis TaxID=1442586 RepID=UPI001304FBD6|nr:FkbM family methyltransferase [Winogradskyella wandonensis]
MKIGTNPLVTAKMQDGTNIIVNLTTRTERDAFYTGLYDEDLLSSFLGLVKDESIILDVGGNIGFYSVANGKYIRDNNLNTKLISFEPFEGNYRRHKKNIELNQLESICQLENYGLSDEDKTSKITLREDFKKGSKTGNAAIPTGGKLDEGFEVSEIKLKVLDDIWPNFKNDFNIDLIKIDIEGHEDFFLRGAQKCINAHRPTMLMEVNKPFYTSRGVNIETIFTDLIPKDYSMYKLEDSKWNKISSFESCKKIDNVFLVPKEKLEIQAYSIFN